jgi:hypothetical protein
MAGIARDAHAGSTVGYACILHERFSPAQRAGLGLCALAVAAIALN